MESIGFVFYVIFIVSWFLRLTVRYPALGDARLDLFLAAIIFIIFIFFIDKKNIIGLENSCYRRMKIFILIIIAITPFSEWPGSVIKTGLPNFVKAIVFFFFTVWFVQTEKRLKIFVAVFLLCQSFRVLEPLYLHLTQGYWGSIASMANWESMNRLSGAPHDIINPNGLAFVVLTILPFLLYLYSENIFWKIVSIVVIPTSLYVLYLTGSRSGMLGLMVILFIFILQSKRKVFIIMLIAGASTMFFTKMDGVFKDRYVSIVAVDSANAATAQGRIDGIWEDFRVGMRRPVFGHGLGTSSEANANFGLKAQISHNLYTETFQEIGIFGLGIFMSVIFLMFKNILKAKCINSFKKCLRHSLIVFASMNLFFGLASYGLSSYEWYFLAALSLILLEQKDEGQNETESSSSSSVAGWGNSNLSSLCLSKF